MVTTGHNMATAGHNPGRKVTPEVDFLKTWAHVSHQVWVKNWSEEKKISEVKIEANGFHKNFICGTMKRGENLKFGENHGGTKSSKNLEIWIS